MNYNNFPVGYQPLYYQGAPNTPISSAQGNTGSSIIWVQGEAGAKSYLVAPNQSVTLWDSESQTIYLKSADASGMPSIKTLDYTIRGGQPTHEMPKVEYATRDDLISLQNEFNEFKARLKPRKEKGNE